MTNEPKMGTILGGASWFGALAMVERVALFLAGILVARLIGPEAFGLYAIAVLAIGIPNELLRYPVGDAVVNRQQEDRESFDLTWTLNLRRIPIAVFVWLIAPYLAAFFSEPKSASVIRWAVLAYAFGALQSPALLRSRMRLDFRRLAMFNHLVFWAEIVATVVAAIVFGNVAALVIGRWANNLSRVFLSYLIFPYRPRIAWNYQLMRKLWGYGRWVWTEGALLRVSDHSVVAVVGKMLDGTSLGLFSKSRSLALAPLEIVRKSLEPVLFPAYSAMKGKAERIARYNRALTSAYLVVGIFLGGVMFTLAADFVPLLLGREWIGMVPLLRALLPVFFLYGPILVLAPSVLKGIGRPDVSARILAAYSILVVLLTFIGVRAIGALGAALGIGIALLIVFFVWGYYMDQLGLLEVKTVIRLYGGAGLLFILGLLVVEGSYLYIDTLANLENLGILIVQGTVSVLVFGLASVLVLGFPAYKELRQQVFALMGRFASRELSETTPP